MVTDLILSGNDYTNDDTYLLPQEDHAASRWDNGRSIEDSKVFHLEHVRDSLQRRRDMEDPQDYEISPRTLRVAFDHNAVANAQILFPDGLGEPMSVTRHALTQLSRMVMPARGLATLRSTARREFKKGAHEGTGIANALWAIHAKDAEPTLIRTVVRNGQREIRAALSGRYMVYDGLEMIGDILDTLGSDADNYGVTSVDIRDSGMRVRLVDMDDWQGRKVDVPMATIDLSNSEVGRRAVYVNSGTFTLWCSNGCGHWSNTTRRRWNHSGSTAERIKSGVRRAMEECMIESRGMVEAYHEALMTQVVGEEFLRQFASDDLTDTQMNDAIEQMAINPTVHGKGRLLASVVDAVTWVAHEQISQYEQERLERVGGILLNKGLQMADDHRIPLR